MSILIIAEAGVNHNGDMDTALRMIDAAKEAKADIVKFQVSITSTSKFSEKAEYQKKAVGEEGSQLDMIKKLRFTFEQHKQLKEYCDSERVLTPEEMKEIEAIKQTYLVPEFIKGKE